MTPELIALGQLAIKSRHWKWLQGMTAKGVGIHEEGKAECQYVLGYDDDYNQTYFLIKPLPDFSNPATLGCLLYLVRQAYKAPWIDVVCESANDPDYVWRVNLDNNCFRAASEAEALVAALESAT